MKRFKTIAWMIVALVVGTAGKLNAQVDPGNTFQVLSLAAIGGADFPRSQGWKQKGLNRKALTYVCRNDSCNFDVFTFSFGRSVRHCTKGAEVRFTQSVMVISADCADPE